MVIERDNQLGASSELKKLYPFDLRGLSDGELRSKVELADVLCAFAPYEKVESLALSLYAGPRVGLDNDGGEVESRLVNLGWLEHPFASP